MLCASPATFARRHRPLSKSCRQSDFPGFAEAASIDVRKRLRAFVTDASPEQERAWSDSIPRLQDEVENVLLRNQLARDYSTILEYELPLESRRPDAILLIGGGLLVIELKGKLHPSQADIDQASAYARDLQCYHRECEGRPVVPVLVPTRAHGYVGQEGPVHIAGPDALDALVQQVTDWDLPPVHRSQFLDESAYRPLPTLVKAARELLERGELRRIHRAQAATEPAVQAIRDIVHEAARTRTRHLIARAALSLDVELRQHTVRDLHTFVAGLLAAEAAEGLRAIAGRLDREGFHLRLTRDLDVATAYLRERYAENPDARFGIVASAKDKSLPAFGVFNDFQSTKRVRMGPWYGDDEGSARSCRQLTSCVTEFGAQGLELDAALLAWGTDLRLDGGTWSNARAAGYQKRKLVRDARQLRINAYRVLLTRARDAVVVFVPPLPDMDETAAYLDAIGFVRL